MSPKKRWSDLSPGRRRFLVIAGVVEGILKIVALRDLKRRPATEIRGPKWLWASSVSVISSFGILPIFYLVFGRKREPATA